MKELVSIIIPILNPDLNPTHERLLHNSLQVLANYPVVFITFPDADLSIVREHKEEIDVVYFSKEYFESREALGKLFLMADFYEQFSWSSFLLIHELNTWIFKDELHYWCKQGYDYLRAAPVSDKTSAFDHLLDGLSRFKGLSGQEKENLGIRFQDNGLYLCLIERMVKTLKSRQKTSYQYRHEHNLVNRDSVFWELEANRFWTSLRKPTAIVQSYFAQHIDNQTNGIPGIKDNLPFALTGITAKNIDSLAHFK